MQESPQVAEALRGFYERFSSGDPVAFADGIADCPGVSVVGSGAGEGHEGRADWIETYAGSIVELGLALRGESPRGWSEGTVGWGRDTPSLVLPDRSRLSTRLTAVLHQEDGEWKIVHLHFSVGVPDDDAIQPA